MRFVIKGMARFAEEQLESAQEVVQLKFTVARKGLILVGIPLLIELALLAGMAYLLHETEVAALRMNKSYEILDALNTLSSDVGQIHVLIGAQDRIVQLIPRLKNLTERAALLRKHLVAVKDLMERDPQSHANAARVTKLIEQYDFQQQSFADTVQSHSVGLLADQMKSLKQFAHQYFTDASFVWFSVLNGEQKKQLSENLNKHLQWQERTKSFVAVAVAVNVLIASLLAVFFSRTISDRLKTIAQNVKRFADDQPLNSPVSGSDEIKDLDQKFHEMAAALREAREREESVQNLRNQLVAMVTHEIRTPLQSVSAFLEYLECFGNLGDEPARLLRIADDDSARIKRLVNDMLDMEKLDSGSMPLNLTEFSLSALVENAKESLALACEKKNISVTVTGDARIQADSHRIEQVVTNLLSNAVKYSQTHSPIEVRIEEAGNQASVSVADRGAGIPVGMLQRVFEPFQQARSTDAHAYGGSGLGLSICKLLIELHGGTIAVQSKEGEGSTFTFIVPLRQPPQATSS